MIMVMMVVVVVVETAKSKSGREGGWGESGECMVGDVWWVWYGLCLHRVVLSRFALLNLSF